MTFERPMAPTWAGQTAPPGEAAGAWRLRITGGAGWLRLGSESPCGRPSFSRYSSVSTPWSPLATNLTALRAGTEHILGRFSVCWLRNHYPHPTTTTRGFLEGGRRVCQLCSSLAALMSVFLGEDVREIN